MADGFNNEVLGAGNRRMGAILIVLASPQPVQQSLGALPAPRANPLAGIAGCPLSIPDVMCDHCSKGIGLLCFAIGEETLVNGLCTSKVSRLVVPKAPSGRMGSDSLPHVLRETVLDPADVVGPVNGIVHLHDNGSVHDVVGIPTFPQGGVDGLDVELDKM